MSNTVVSIDIQVESKSLNDLENELAQINEELGNMAIGSEGFKKLSQQSQGLTKEINKANTAIEGMTSDKKFMAADGAIKTMAGSLSAVVGTLGIIGVDSAVFGDMERKAASAIAVAMGVKDISEGYKQLKESTVLATLSSKIFGNVTKTALISTGIGAFIVALGVVAAYWDDIIDYLGGANAKLEKQNTLIEEQVDTLDINLDLLRLNQRAAELRGESEVEIVAEIKKQLILQQAANEQLLTNLQLQLQVEQSKQAEVTLWEKTKILANSLLGPAAMAESIAKATNNSNEETIALQERINEAKTKGANIEIALAEIENKKKTKAAEDFKVKTDLQKAHDLLYLTELQKLEDERLSLAAKTEEQKLKLAKDNQIKEIEALKLSEAEKTTLKLAAEANYATASADLLAETEKEKTAKRIERENTEVDRLLELQALQAVTIEEKKQAQIAEIEANYLRDYNQAVAAGETTIGLEELKAEKILAIHEDAKNKTKIIDEEAAKAKEAVTTASIDAIQGALTNLFGKSKGIASANVIIDAAQAGVGIIKSAKDLPPPLAIPFQISQFALLATTTFKSLKAINSASPTGAGTRPSFPTSTGFSSNERGGAPQPIAVQAPQQLTTTAGNRAYVLTGDVMTGIEAQARLDRRRTL